MPTTRDGELAREQAYVDTLYNRLDEVRDTTRGQLRQVLLEAGTGTPQSVVERDVFAASHADRLARLDAAEGRLCFGAMDHADGRRTYIGRIGLSDREQEPILVDWRAPVATAFYQATIADPRGLSRRRHLRTRAREVTGIADDPLDPRAFLHEAGSGTGAGGDSANGDNAAGAAARPGGASASGDTMLLEALSAPRTGRMHDIISTLQAEQDRIIRAASNAVLVVDGGPGTGKTAVALHRAAYLLYTDRDRLARSGVLVVGPSAVFLRYIEQVLPSLGETGVVFATPSRLFPGVNAVGEESVAAASLKGEERMAEIIAAAVRDRQRVPAGGLRLRYDDHDLQLDRDTINRARTRARRSRRPHNSARRVFVRELLKALTNQVVSQLPGGLFEPEERAEVTADLWADPAIRGALDELWPLLTPVRLLTDLYTSPELLARAAGTRLTTQERALLLRVSSGAVPTADGDALDAPDAARPGRSGRGSRRGTGARRSRSRRVSAVAVTAHDSRRHDPSGHDPSVNGSGGHDSAGSELAAAGALDPGGDLFSPANRLPGACGGAEPEATPVPNGVPAPGGVVATSVVPDGVVPKGVPVPEGAPPPIIWTPADVPLLDEAAELLGDPEEEARLDEERRVAAERAAEREYAQEVLEMLGLDGRVDADTVAERWGAPRQRRSAAEHASEDRTWTFGHLIVDEAQEISPMLWRLLWRRCPGRTATLVGDLAQAARPQAPATWRDLLGPAVGEWFTVERLTVNYRTPQEIMDVAADVLAAGDPDIAPPLSVRSVGRRPDAVRILPPDPADAGPVNAGRGDAGPGCDLSVRLERGVVREAVRAAGEAGEGRVAVICPPGRVAAIRAALRAAAPRLVVPADTAHRGAGAIRRRPGTDDPGRGSINTDASLDAPVAVLTVAESKGLEFDAVILVEPAEMLAGPTRGLADLYVALTRATRAVTVVHAQDLPVVLHRLVERDAIPATDGGDRPALPRLNPVP